MCLLRSSELLSCFTTRHSRTNPSGLSEDVRQIGDYPVVPRVYTQKEEPFGYWDQQERRNFNQPVCRCLCLLLARSPTLQLHEEDEALGVWIWDTYYANETISALVVVQYEHIVWLCCFHELLL